MKKILFRVGIVFVWVLFLAIMIFLSNKITDFFNNERSINIFTWGDILDPSVVAEFEEKTHIKVNLSNYSSNEELLVKMKSTKGRGYDLITPSDYAINALRTENLLKPLDKNRLDFLEKINPSLLNHYFDPDNIYSIPFEWEMFGFGVDLRSIPNPKASWDLIFDTDSMNYKIVMLNDPIEAVLFASYHLFGPMDSLDVEQMAEVKNLLLAQKKFVEAYAEFRGDYFLVTGNCPIAVSSSSYIYRAKKLFPFVSFKVPQEGTFITIENFAIPQASNKEDLVYEFLNFVYKPKSVLKHFDTFAFFPATTEAIDLLPVSQSEKKFMKPSKEDFKKYHFTKTVAPQQEIRDLWIEVKSGTSD